jgi:hypothetical protein
MRAWNMIDLKWKYTEEIDQMVKALLDICRVRSLSTRPVEAGRKGKGTGTDTGTRSSVYSLRIGGAGQGGLGVR